VDPDGNSAQLASTAEQKSRIAEERPPHPESFDVATPAQEASALAARNPKPKPAPKPAPEPEPAPAPEADSGSPGSIPPASAGSNGSFTPPPPDQRKTINPRTFDDLEEMEGEGVAVSLNGIALAPPSAPPAIKAAISAANEIVGRPYIWGGGHASWYSTGYDCSGAVSYALGAAGFLDAPMTSSSLESWGDPGPGRWLTVYANAGHAYAVIAGLRWDTVGDAQGTGPRWHPAAAYPEGFTERHPPGF
jgi:cell wall-associated NlpC family hydrolase